MALPAVSGAKRHVKTAAANKEDRIIAFMVVFSVDV
jgi:hypothetical protein